MATTRKKQRNKAPSESNGYSDIVIGRPEDPHQHGLFISHDRLMPDRLKVRVFLAGHHGLGPLTLDHPLLADHPLLVGRAFQELEKLKGESVGVRDLLKSRPTQTDAFPDGAAPMNRTISGNAYATMNSGSDDPGVC